ncbi:MAG: ATP-binding protein [Elusimicrobiota bacterium]|nr:MAG: ATP-binding protein [Elusimicrobiota bacterium]
MPLSAALETERRIVREISAIVVAIGGVAFGLVLVLVRGILAPIRGLLSGISSIGVGDYDVRVPVLSRDELGELAESFNAMSAQLARTTVSKEYVEGVLENMRDLLLVTDSAGRVKTANHAAAEALGGAVVGRPLAELLSSDDGFAAPKAARDAEVALLAKDGGRIPALLSSAPLRDREGRPQGWIVVAKDITERKRDEEALVRAKLAAEASSRELEAFSYSVAHDLRAPLRAVDGFSQILLDGYSDKLDDHGKDYLRRVRAGSRRMGQLIDDLLNLSRITRSVLKLEDVDLSAIVEELAGELKRSDPKRSVEFAVEPGVVVRGDPNLLRVALVNLMSNAWKYTGKKPSARIEFGRRPGPGTTLYVRDDGAGFDMAFANKLFHPFSRLHSASEFEGTGIGLAIVQRVVGRHRGNIRGEGVPGRGATFEFTLWEENA